MLRRPALPTPATATLKGQTLVVKGDDQGAELLLAPPVELARGPAGPGESLAVTPQGATTVNGAAAAASR